MKVSPLQGQPTCFSVESRSLQCPQCTRKFNHRRATHGDACKFCGVALKQVLPYHVDVAELFPIGRCACVQGSVKAATARKLPLAVRLELGRAEQDAMRCEHLKEARCFFLNRELAQFERERLKNGHGKKEDAC